MDRRPASVQMDGQSVPASEQIIVKASQCREECVKSRGIDEPKPDSIEPTHIEEPIKKIDVKPQPERTIDHLPILERGGPSFMNLPKLKKTVSRSIEIPRNDPKTIEIDERIIDGPVIDADILPVMQEQISVTDIPIIDELKRPMTMRQNSPQSVEKEREHLKEILDEKTKRACVLEAMLGIYESKHQIINNLLTCKQKQLEELIKAYTNATSVELMIENVGGCGCTASGPKIIDVESILVTVGSKSYDFRFGFNDAYADMVRHGINLKQVIA